MVNYFVILFELLLIYIYLFFCNLRRGSRHLKAEFMSSMRIVALYKRVRFVVTFLRILDLLVRNAAVRQDTTVPLRKSVKHSVLSF